jgi:hypothetical protein
MMFLFSGNVPEEDHLLMRAVDTIVTGVSCNHLIQFCILSQ